MSDMRQRNGTRYNFGPLAEAALNVVGACPRRLKCTLGAPCQCSKTSRSKRDFAYKRLVRF